MSEEDRRQPNGGEENGSGDSNAQRAQKEWEYRLLGGIGVQEFAANPPEVPPFETTTLFWRATIPPGLPPVSFTVVGQAVYATNSGASGSATAAPLSTTEYDLFAETAIVNRQVAASPVRVNDAACESPALAASLITDHIHDAIVQQLPKDNSQFSVDSSKVKVVSNDNIISIEIPASIDIKAQIEIGLKGIPPHATISAQPGSISAHVDTSTLGNIVTLGCASAVASAVEDVVEIFVGLIVKNTIAPEIADNLNSLVQNYATTAQEIDPEHRTFALTSVTLSDMFLTFTVCPLPGSSKGALPTERTAEA